MSKTVRVTSPISDDNPNGFVVINVSDFDPTLHQPFSDEDVDVLRGADLKDLHPTIVAGAHDEISRMRADLDAEAARQRAQADVPEDERVRLAAEATRLAEWAAQLAAAEQNASTAMTAVQMKEALTARGIEFKGNASKADLQALLDAAPPV